MGDFYFFLPYRWLEIVDELKQLMKEMMAEQKARIALNNHLAQIKYAKKSTNKFVPQACVHIYYPIRATKCNKVGFEQRCRRTTDKKYGKKLA
jgi:hypothetical protein